MRRVVTDCSVIIPAFFPESGKGVDAALHLFDEMRLGTARCAAPTLLQAEFGNTALKKFRRGECDLEQAVRQVQLFERLELDFYASGILVEAALRCASRLDLTVYDSLYLVLAQALKAELATLDGRLAGVANGVGVALYS